MKTAKIILILTILFVIVVAFTISTKEYYHSEKNPVLDEIRRRFTLLSPDYAKIPLKTGKESFTEDKSVITLCITNPITNSYYDMNTLTYVALHELSHVLTKAEGKESHGTEFKGNFTKLLDQAAQLGLYNPNKAIPATYCKL